MTVKGGTTPACAACKYQRRKCNPSCLLAPYFPANQPDMFQHVHRLFGVSNVTKTLQRIKSKDHRDDAMRSIIYESEMRARFPAYGCCAVIAHLHQQLLMACEELYHVCAKLEACREQMMHNNKAPSSSLDCWLDSTNEGVYAVGHGQVLESFSDEAIIGDLGSVQTAQQLSLEGFQENCNNIGFDVQQICNGYSSDERKYYFESKIENREE